MDQDLNVIQAFGYPTVMIWFKSQVKFGINPTSDKNI